jgi:hypothetical protein
MEWFSRARALDPFGPKNTGLAHSVPSSRHLKTSLAVGNVVERIAEIIVLAEDLNQGNFARHYLIRSGHEPRTVRLRLSPSGRGSAEQYIREQYPTEVKNYRYRASSRKAALIVLIDADVGTVVEHERELEKSLRRAGEAKRNQAEAIALLVPKRNIESWILCLLGEVIDETTDYKGIRDIRATIKQAAGAFFDWSRTNFPVPGHCVSSLRRALSEIRRIG